MPKSPPPSDYVDSPIAWFSELLIAWEGRDLGRVFLAYGELSRLGWTFYFCDPPAEQKAREGTR